MLAFILGFEVECRIGRVISPGHYARGWHITSTCEVFGSVAGAANRRTQLMHPINHKSPGRVRESQALSQKQNHISARASLDDAFASFIQNMCRSTFERSTRAVCGGTSASSRPRLRSNDNPR